MLIRAPAIIFGIVAVFLAGVRLSYSFLDDFERMKNGNNALDQKAVQKIEIISYIGGGVAVALFITLLLRASEEGKNIILITLTILGILFGLYTLLNPSKDSKSPRIHNDNHREQNRRSYSEPKIIVTCTNCSQKLRIPMRNRKVTVTCPACHHEFEYP